MTKLPVATIIVCVMPAGITITLATVEMGSDGQTIYECRATGNPLPITITWTALNRQGNRVTVGSDNAGIQVRTIEDGDETVGTLVMASTSNFDMPMCTAANGNNRTRDNGIFEPVIGTSYFSTHMTQGWWLMIFICGITLTIANGYM